MPFEKGKPKTGGRQKGTPNKDKRTVREIVETALGKAIPERIMELVAYMEPEREIELLLDLLPYTYPKKKEVAVSGELDLNHNDEALTAEVAELKEMFQAMASEGRKK